MQLIEHFTLLASTPPKKVSILPLAYILKVSMESFSTVFSQFVRIHKKENMWYKLNYKDISNAT